MKLLHRTLYFGSSDGWLPSSIPNNLYFTNLLIADVYPTQDFLEVA